jgi:acyl-CoA synthetase (AMP-forming)/AMP-acid ligase II
MNRFADRLKEHMRSRAGCRAASIVTAGGRRDLDFAAMETDCRRFAALYRSRRLPRGGTVLLFLRHVPELYGGFFGAMLDGLAPSLMPCSSPRQDPDRYWRSHATLLRRIRPAAVVADAATFGEMRAAGLDLAGAAEIDIAEAAGARPLEADFATPDGSATALLQHSSGTTGLKKGVRLSFDAIAAQVESYAAALGAGMDDRVVSWLPLYHDMGLIACMMTPAYLGIPVTHIDPFHWLSHPGLLLDLMTEEEATFTWLPNFAFEHLALTAARNAGSYRLGGVRAFVNCSEPCRPGTFDRFARAFEAAGVRQEQLQCCYAMAETVFAVSQTALGERPMRVFADAGRLRSEGLVVETAPDAEDAVELIETGQVIDGLSVEIRDADRRPLEPGRVGEVAISGRFLFDGYNEDAERTAEKLQDGIYHTGDLGFVLRDRLFVLGRNDDLMIINGRNIYGHEAEAELAGIGGLKPGRAVVLAHADERIGSQVMIVIAERDGAGARSDAEVRREISDRMFSVFQVMPRAVELVDGGWLVKTTSGKIGRAANLEKYLAMKAEGGARG